MQQSPELHLAAHVHACVDRDWLIFLDLKHDRYHAAPAAFAAFLGLSGAAPEVCTEALPLITKLIGAGLIEPLPKTASERLPLRNGHPAGSPDAPADRFPDVLPYGFASWLRLIRAALWANMIVERGELLAARQRLRALKRNLEEPQSGDVDEAHAFFEKSRPWIAKPYVCLFDSLCLSRFLIAAGFGVELVLGVRARPFAAHAWVEMGGTVFDDGGEDCASYAVIARF
jgi:hypothetical protein